MQISMKLLQQVQEGDVHNIAYNEKISRFTKKLI